MERERPGGLPTKSRRKKKKKEEANKSFE